MYHMRAFFLKLFGCIGWIIMRNKNIISISAGISLLLPVWKNSDGLPGSYLRVKNAIYEAQKLKLVFNLLTPFSVRKWVLVHSSGNLLVYSLVSLPQNFSNARLPTSENEVYLSHVQIEIRQFYMIVNKLHHFN